MIGTERGMYVYSTVAAKRRLTALRWFLSQLLMMLLFLGMRRKGWLVPQRLFILDSPKDETAVGASRIWTTGPEKADYFVMNSFMVSLCWLFAGGPPCCSYCLLIGCCLVVVFSPPWEEDEPLETTSKVSLSRLAIISSLDTELPFSIAYDA